MNSHGRIPAQPGDPSHYKSKPDWFKPFASPAEHDAWHAEQNDYWWQRMLQTPSKTVALHQRLWAEARAKTAGSVQS